MATRERLLTIDALLDIVVKMKVPLLYLGWYLFSVEWQYLPRGGNGNALYITTSGIVFITSYVIPLATIPFL